MVDLHGHRLSVDEATQFTNTKGSRRSACRIYSTHLHLPLAMPSCCCLAFSLGSVYILEPLLLFLDPGPRGERSLTLLIPPAFGTPHPTFPCRASSTYTSTKPPGPSPDPTFFLRTFQTQTVGTPDVTPLIPTLSIPNLDLPYPCQKQSTYLPFCQSLVNTPRPVQSRRFVAKAPAGNEGKGVPRTPVAYCCPCWPLGFVFV
jgi:hypothetical protein